MYESHVNTDSRVNQSPGRFDEELPEPPDQWSLDDFSDIIGLSAYAS